MKNILSVLTLALLIGSANKAIAKTGGFEGPGVNFTTVKEALNLKDDAHVVLMGKIEQSLGDDKYLFNDGTSTITVEIDQEAFAGLTITPEDMVEIRGEIDRTIMKIEVDVDTISKK